MDQVSKINLGANYKLLQTDFILVRLDTPFNFSKKHGNQVREDSVFPPKKTKNPGGKSENPWDFSISDFLREGSQLGAVLKPFCLVVATPGPELSTPEKMGDQKMSGKMVSKRERVGFEWEITEITTIYYYMIIVSLLYHYNYCYLFVTL